MPIRLGALLTTLVLASAVLAATRPQHLALDDGDALALAFAWGLAAAITAWHAFGVAVCAAARAWPGRRGLTRWVAWTPRVVRRAAGVAWGASVLLSPALAHGQTVDEPFVRAPAVEAPAVEAPATTAPATTTTTVLPTQGAAPAPTVASPPTASAVPIARHHVVVAGDNLWRIAAAEVAPLGRTSERDIAAYWRVVIDANRATLRSGNPNLIYPGEVITLPPLEPAPG